MSYWNILGIDQTDDAAAIKRAYAARLKHTRPDEDPEGFGLLHRAYKQALADAKRLSASVSAATLDVPRAEPERLTVSESAPVGQPDESRNDVGAAPERELISGQPVVPEEERVEELRAAWERLTAAASDLLSDSHRANQVDNWRFLETEEALYDFGFKREFSSFLFARIMEQYDLKKPAIGYLDSLFRWSEQRDTLELQHGYEDVELLLGSDRPAESIRWFCPKHHTGPLVYGNYYARMFATLLDVVLMTFVYEGLLRLAFQPLGDNALFGGIGLFLIAAPILEATPMQGTPAKVLFGLKVTSSRGTRLNPLHSIARTVAYATSTALFKITVWINLFTNDGRLLHDRVSGSLVVKRTD